MHSGRKDGILPPAVRFLRCSIGDRADLPQLWAKGNLSLRSRVPKKVYSKIRMAEAITVVQRPRLSPTPLWVMLVVRTILLEIL